MPQNLKSKHTKYSNYLGNLTTEQAVKRVETLVRSGLNTHVGQKRPVPYFKICDYFELMHRQDGNGRPKN